MKIRNRAELKHVLDEKEFMHVELTCDKCMSAKEKAEFLNRSVDTVNTYMKRIFKKVDITKVTELSKIFFTMSVLSAIFGLHGIIDNQSRTRVNSVQRNVVASNRRNSRRRRRERDIPLSDFYNYNTISA